MIKRLTLLLGIAVIAAAMAVPSFATPQQVQAAADFRIVDVRAEYGQMVVEVQHFNPDGSHWFFEHYTFQGREQYKRPRVVDQLGNSPKLRLFLKSDGSVAPLRQNDLGEEEHYLPAREQWLRQSRPHLDQGSITRVIQQIHEQRLVAGWTKGQLRLSTAPLDPNSDDVRGAPALVQRFTGLIDQAYIVQDDGTMLAYGSMPPTSIPLGSQFGTVSPFYPDADPESTSHDGGMYHYDVNGVTWATAHGAATATAANAYGSIITMTLTTHSSSPKWTDLRRSTYLFDTSAIADTDVVSSATFGFVLTGVTDNFDQSMAMVTSTPNTNTDLITSDFDQLGTVDQATDLDVSNLTADSATFNNFTLNATGLGNISLTSISKFGMRFNGDADGVEPTWAASTDVTITVASADEVLSGDRRPVLMVTHSVASSAAITGTIGDGATEQEVRDGTGTIIITLTGDTWVASGGSFDAQRQAIINGLDAAESETAGWNAQVRDQISVGSVVRTSSTVATVTITGSEVASYQIDSNETITVTVPSAALVTSSSDITATPTIAITAAAESAVVTGTLSDFGRPSEIVAGGETIVITLTNTAWADSGATFNAQRQNIIDNLDSNLSDQNGWDARRSDFAVGDVVRTSDTVMTITLSGASAYAIPATETITVTVPASAVDGGALTTTPTFNIIPLFASSGNRVSAAINLSSVTDVAYCSLAWETATPTGTTVTFDTSTNGGTSYTTGHANGSCPAGITVGSSLASISDFRIRVNMTTTVSGATPSLDVLALLIEDASGQDLYYQLNTTPGVTITDRSTNTNVGTMSYPVGITGVSQSVGTLTTTRAQLSTQQALTSPAVVTAVTGSATSNNLFNTTEVGWTGLPGKGIVDAIAQAGDGLPTRAVWFMFLGLLIIGMGFAALSLTQNLFMAAVAMGVGIGFTMAMGNGLLPGWIIYVFLPMVGAFLLVRKGLPL